MGGGNGVDGRSFDHLTRALARNLSRRATVRHLVLAGAVASLLGRVSSRPGALALPARQEACPQTHPWQVCDDACVNVETDPAHCGGCGLACEPGLFCRIGWCGPCDIGLTQCGEACVDLQSDPAHCGGCGTVCQFQQQCTVGEGCAPGLSVCGDACVNTQIDRDHCGSCGNSCGADFAVSCVNGTCCDGKDPCCFLGFPGHEFCKP
jgi:hypothetical protein